MHIDFHLNGSEYQVSEYHGGWGWFGPTRDEESSRCFATALEAQQDAIDWEASREAREAEAEEDDVDAKTAAYESAYDRWKANRDY